MNFDFLICAIRELKRNKRRTIAAFAGYLITVAVLLSMAAFVFYSKIQQSAVIGSTGTHFVTWLPSCGDLSSLTDEELSKLALGIIPEKCKQNCNNCTGCNKKPKDILNEGFVINTNTTRLITLELVKQIDSLDDVKNASPFLMFRFRDPTTNHLFVVAGMFPEHLAVQTNSCGADEIVEGEYLCEKSMGKIIVDYGYAFNRGLKIGSKVTIAEEKFEIIGIAVSGADPVKADFYMLFTEAERVISKRIHNPLENEANIVLIESIDGTRHAQAMSEVEKIMKSDSAMTSGCYLPASKAMGLNDSLLKAFIWIIIMGSVLLTVKIQYSSVLERRKDIAILKAIGWTDKAVLLQLLAESYLVSFVGCFFGMVIGVVFLSFCPPSMLLGVEAETIGVINYVSVFAIILFSVFSGGLAGAIPVFLVLKQSPMDALRRL